jgi:hypothetical protein
MRTTRIITTPLVALLCAATLAGPAAAVPADPPPAAKSQPSVQPVAPLETRSAGFDWGSAGIGAAGGVGAFAIMLAGTAGIRRRHL